MIKINDDQIKDFESHLKTFANRAFPFATQNAINSVAFKAQKFAKFNVGRKMTLRNKFTQNSIKVHKTKTLQLSRQSALVGSTEKYMERQEFGGNVQKSGKIGVSIPTGYSAGQEGAQKRTRLPKKANRIKNIRLNSKRSGAKSRKLNNFLLVREVAQKSNKYVYLDLGRRQGIFKVTGVKNKTKVKMVQDLSRDVVRIPRNPWLKPSTDSATKFLPELYKKALIFQLKRQNIFKG